MLNGILFLFIIFFGQTFIESVEYPFGITLTNEISQKECDMRRWSSNESFVCACNSTYCDQPEPLGQLRPGKAVLFMSDPIKMRLKRTELQKGEPNAAIKNDGIKENIFNNFFQDPIPTFQIRVDASVQYQKIFGFGGAFTDAAGYNMQTLSNETRLNLLRAYFDKEIGKITHFC